MLRNLIVSIGVAALSGCGAIMVSSPSGTALDGIPFYSKVPALTQETKWVQSALLVTVTLGTVTPAGLIEEPLVNPPSGALEISVADRGAADDVISQMYLDVQKTTSVEDAQRVITDAMNDLKHAATAPTETLASNSWSMEMVVGPRPYYINTRMPLMGTASGTYKLSADGTLSEGTASVTDDTVKNVLSLLPINAKLSQQWGVPTAKGPGVEARKTVLRVDVKMVERRTITTLRIVEAPVIEKDAYLDLKARAPLHQSDVAAGKVQLVSKEVVTGTGTDDKAKADTTSYKIQGTFTPPKVPGAK